MATGFPTSVIDLFCGVGGLTHGFFKEGFTILAGIDTDSSCKYAFETNNNSIFINKSIEDITGEELSKIFQRAKTKILIGCAPCQPYSPYNLKKDKNDKWKLLADFSRLVIQTRPDVVSMENVPHMQWHHAFLKFKSTLSNEGYILSQYSVYCPDYGIPQGRRRLLLFASRFGEVKLIPKTHTRENYKTLRETIYNLKPIRAGSVDKNDPLHRSRNLTPLNIKRIRSTPEGGNWHSWDDSIRLNCHKKESGKSFDSVYGRMSWDEPASTITTEFINFGSGRFGHPDQDRTISIREAALIQTFPKYYKLFANKSDITFQKLGRHIGNAVPVRLARIIARTIKKHLEEYNIVV